MDVPALGTFTRIFWLVELTDVNSIAQSMQVDVAVHGSSDDEFAALDVFVLNYLDCIDECFVSDDEDFFDEVVLG